MSDESLKILAEDILDFLNTIESACVKLKMQIDRNLGPEPEQSLDFDKLFWETKKGEKGPFEQTSEKANGNSDLWKQLKAKLKEHHGFWQNSGYKFWFDMQNESVVDRRKVS